MALEKDLDTEIGKKFKNMLIEQLKPIGLKESDIKINSNFYGLGADEIDLFEMIEKVEEIYGINVIDEEVLHIRTVGQAIDYINAKYNENNPQQ